MAEYLTTLVGPIIALSGWAKVLYDHVTSRPRICGRVFQVILGQMANPAQAEEPLAAFVVYLYLVNRRRNTIHVLDYEMEIRVARKWTRLSRVYGIHNVQNCFASASGPIQIENFEANLIYRKNKPVEYGQPLHGWIVFVGPESLRNSRIKAFRVTCIDAFQKKHRLLTKDKGLASVYLLQDIADIKVPVHGPQASKSAPAER